MHIFASLHSHNIAHLGHLVQAAHAWRHLWYARQYRLPYGQVLVKKISFMIKMNIINGMLSPCKITSVAMWQFINIKHCIGKFDQEIFPHWSCSSIRLKQILLVFASTVLHVLPKVLSVTARGTYITNNFYSEFKFNIKWILLQFHYWPSDR